MSYWGGMTTKKSKSNIKIPHILQVIVGNTSTMDYSLPIFWKLKNDYPNVRISCLYCVYDRRMILRQSVYFSEFYEKLGINEFDFIDFLRPEFKFLNFILRKRFSQCPDDSYRAFDVEGSTKSKKNLVLEMWNKMRKYSKEKIILFLLRTNRILKILCPDLILFDNRAFTQFHGRAAFYSYFEKEKLPIVLLQHGPHYRTPGNFCPFDELGEVFPDYCEDWLPFRVATPWAHMPEKKDQFHDVGYPGYDQEWIEHLISSQKTKKIVVTKESLRCCFIIRDFFPQGYIRPDVADPITPDYEEFSLVVQSVGRAIRETGRDIEVIIKPHPRNNLEMVNEVFMESGLSNWWVSQEPFFELLPKIDFVISYFSTTMLLPIAAKIPTIILDNRAQRHLNKNWEQLEHLYTGFQFFLKDNNYHVEYLKRVLIEIDQNESESSASKDYEHIRRFFPDGAIDRGISRLEQLLPSLRKN